LRENYKYHNLEEARSIAKDNDLDLISDEYINCNIKLTLRDKEDYLYFANILSLNNKSFPRRFCKTNPYTIHNIKLWCKLNNKPFELLSNIYEGNNKNLKWKCLKDGCGEIFNMRWRAILDNQNCPFCIGFKVGLSNCLVTRDSELSKEWHPTKNGDLTPYDVTCGSNKHVWWVCKECGYEWFTDIFHRSNGSGCPQCNKSKGEKRIKKRLDNNGFIEINQEEYDKLNYFNKITNIYYIPQKTYNKLIGVYGKLLSYDFYLPYYNLLIEYQGEFHDGTAYQQSKEDYRKQLEHDKRKKEYAQNNNIKLSEIWYWDFDNIESILENELNFNKINNSNNTVVFYN